jgi:hypothetical protein
MDVTTLHCDPDDFFGDPQLTFAPQRDWSHYEQIIREGLDRKTHGVTEAFRRYAALHDFLRRGRKGTRTDAPGWQERLAHRKRMLEIYRAFDRVTDG